MKESSLSFSTKQLSWEASIYSISGALPQTINLILLPFYSRLLSPDDYGIIGYVNTIVWFLIITNCLSLNAYYLRTYYEHADRKELSGSLFYFLLATNLIFIVVEGIILYYAFKIFNVSVDFYPYMLLGLFETFFISFSVIPIRHYRLESRAGKFLEYNILNVVLKHGTALFLIIKFNLSAVGFLLGGAVSAFLLAIYFILSAQHFTTFTLRLAIVKKALRFSLPLLPGSYSIVILIMADRIILEKYVVLSELGIYTIGYTLARALNIFISSLMMTIEPQVYKAYSLPSFNELYNKLMDYYMFVVFVVVFLFVVFVDDIVKIILPEQYAAAGGISAIVCYASLFIGIQSIIGLQFMLHYKTFIESVLFSVAAGLNIVLNIIIIPFYGIYGAAVTTVLSYFILMILTIVTAKKIAGKYSIRSRDVGVMILFLFFTCLILLSKNYNIGFGLRIGLSVVFIVICSKTFSIFDGKVCAV